MAVFFLTYSLFVLTLLWPLFLTGADADDVTWSQCNRNRYGIRILTQLPDDDAIGLFIWYCNITEIQSNPFDGLPNLKIINAQSNVIVTVDQAAFRTVPKLTSLCLDDNKLTEVPMFDKPFFPSLQYLDLSKNQITNIKHDKTFSGCPKLGSLYLQRNLIEYIHPDVFRPLKVLKHLYLHYNKITYIPDTMFINNKNLNYLLVQHNRISHLSYNFFYELKRVGISVRECYFYANPWHCNSLLRILKDVKRTGVDYLTYPRTFSDDGTRPVCVLRLSVLL